MGGHIIPRISIYNTMVGFIEWMKSKKLNEMMGSVGSIVSCKDRKNKDFQIQGALSDHPECQKIPKMKKMRFK